MCSTSWKSASSLIMSSPKALWHLSPHMFLMSYCRTWPKSILCLTFWQIYSLLPLCPELNSHSTFPVWMSNSLFWPQPKVQPAGLGSQWSLIGQVHSCVTDRKPADWWRQYLLTIALIKAEWWHFVKSCHSGVSLLTPQSCWSELQLGHTSVIHSLYYWSGKLHPSLFPFALSFFIHYPKPSFILQNFFHNSL